jgi:hypothetical protein
MLNFICECIEVLNTLSTLKVLEANSKYKVCTQTECFESFDFINPPTTSSILPVYLGLMTMFFIILPMRKQKYDS